MSKMKRRTLASQAYAIRAPKASVKGKALCLKSLIKG